jgi:uncharacterized membrane protein (DUF2068 family)
METGEQVRDDAGAVAPAAEAVQDHSVHRSHDIWITLIAIFKLIKGVLLLIVGIGALSLIHKDVAEVIARWVDVIRVDPDNRHIRGLITRIDAVNARKLEEISAGTFFYAALLLTEGTGLLLKKRWAEYFTIIVTGSFIPMEIYELVKHISIAKTLLLAFNLAVVWYLIRRLKRHV